MAMIVCLLAGCASGGKETAQTASTGEGYKVALITMDSIDQHWITLKEGAEKAASRTRRRADVHGSEHQG